MTEILSGWMVRLAEPLTAIVIIILSLFSAWLLVLLGGFLREALQRRRLRRAIEESLDVARRGPTEKPGSMARLAAAGSGLPALLAEAEKRHGIDDAERLFGILNQRVRARLAAHTLLTRVAPMGGLIATLLPLGPALRGLGEGDLGLFADNLTVAFSATVIGLVVSCLAFAMAVARRCWYARDLEELESILLALSPTIEKEQRIAC